MIAFTAVGLTSRKDVRALYSDSATPVPVRSRTVKRNNRELTSIIGSRVQTKPGVYRELSPFARREFGITRSERLTYKTIKKMNRDPVIAFCLGLMSSLVKNLPFYLTSEDKVQEKVLLDALNKHYNHIIEGFVTALYNGYAFAQKLWETEKQKVYFPTENKDGELVNELIFEGRISNVDKVKFIDPSSSSLEYYINIKREELEYVIQYRFENMKRIEVRVDRKDLIWFADGDPFDPIFGRSRYLNIGKEWELGIILYRYLIEEIDRNSAPPVEVAYPEGYSVIENERVENQKIAENLLEQVVGKIGYTIPSDYDKNGNRRWMIEVKKDWNTEGAKIVREHLNYVNQLKAVGLLCPPQLAPFRNREDSATANTASTMEAGLEMLMFIMEAVVSKAEKAIKEDFIEDILLMNYRKENILPYKFEIDRSVFNRRALIKEVLTLTLRTQGQMLTSGKGKPHRVVDFESLLDQLGIPHKLVEEVYSELAIDQEGGDTENGLLNEDEQNEKDNDENRITKRPSRKVKDGEKKTIVDGA